MPVVSQEFRGGGDAPHFGVDLMYGASPNFFVPDGAVPVFAAREGRLWSMQLTKRGWGVVIDHGRPFATYYQHLSSVAPELAVMKRGDAVRAGQPLGVMGADPTDGGHVRHLHFAVWFEGSGDAASVDPTDEMRAWPRRAWPGEVSDG